jgi:hypothetical protein
MHSRQNQTHSLRPTDAFGCLDAFGIPSKPLHVHSLFHNCSYISISSLSSLSILNSTMTHLRRSRYAPTGLAPALSAGRSSPDSQPRIDARRGSARLLARLRLGACASCSQEIGVSTCHTSTVALIAVWPSARATEMR